MVQGSQRVVMCLHEHGHIILFYFEPVTICRTILCFFFVVEDELFTDTFKMELVDDIFYKVKGKVCLCR